MQEKITIPDELIEICKDLARVARDKGLQSFSGRFTPGFFAHDHLRPDWRGEISFSWEQGRHGEDSNNINIQTQAWASAKLTDVKLNQ